MTDEEETQREQAQQTKKRLAVSRICVVDIVPYR